jgi:transcription elongation factor Elf1
MRLRKVKPASLPVIISCVSCGKLHQVSTGSIIAMYADLDDDWGTFYCEHCIPPEEKKENA